jgi:anti-sigma B factor antagonist
MSLADSGYTDGNHMSLQISRRERESISIFDLTGRLVVGPSTNQFRDTLQKAIGEGQYNIILNLEGVEYIDSTGLGALVICFTLSQKGGGALKLLHLNRREMELLVLTKLTTVFDVFSDEQDAVNSFFPDREIKRFDILSFVRQHRDEED